MTADLTESQLVLPKDWYKSKVVWFNLIMTLVDTVAMVQTTIDVFSSQYPDPRWVLATFLLTLIHGFGNVVLRIWFTTSPIKSG